jgi:hypothetical protein
MLGVDVDMGLYDISVTSEICETMHIVYTRKYENWVRRCFLSSTFNSCVSERM